MPDSYNGQAQEMLQAMEREIGYSPVIGAGSSESGVAGATFQLCNDKVATNAVTGLTDALMDSIPIVCLTGQVPTHLIGNDAFQEADTTGITRPCTKHNYLVKDVAERGSLPVVLFCAGGIATPADAALMMQLGAEGNFVG